MQVTEQKPLGRPCLDIPLDRMNWVYDARMGEVFEFEWLMKLVENGEWGGLWW